jgi:hypothetical protein
VALFAVPGAHDCGCCEGPGTGVFKSANPSANSASSRRSASKESSSSPANSWVRRRSVSSGNATSGSSVYEADRRDEGCQSSMTSSVKNSERFPRIGSVNPDGAAMSGRSAMVLLAVHVTSSHSSSESPSDSSSARSRKFGSGFSAHPGTSELSPFCGGTG